MATSSYFAASSPQVLPTNRQVSALHKLTKEGNLISGAASRVFVGFLREFHVVDVWRVI
jgi:hypothetical protein